MGAFFKIILILISYETNHNFLKKNKHEIQKQYPLLKINTFYESID